MGSDCFKFLILHTFYFYCFIIFSDTKTCKHEVMRGDREEQDHWKRFIFDSEQIITSMKISVSPFAIQGLPAFVIAYSRTCNFRGIGADFLMYNGTKRVCSRLKSRKTITVAFAPLSMFLYVLTPEGDVRRASAQSDQSICYPLEESCPM